MPKENKKNNIPEKTEPKKEFRERLRVWGKTALITAAVLLLAVLIFGLLFANKVLFRENPHFKLKKMTLKGGTYWRNKDRLLVKRAGIPDNANLFALDYRSVKKRMEAIPSIEKAEIRYALPDQLHIRIWERIPRALLFYPGSPWLVDEEGVVIPRRESAITRSTQLPVITFEKRISSPSGGEKVSQVKPALDLIMMTLRNFPDIEIMSLKVKNNDRIEFVMRYRGGKFYLVTLPIQNRGLPFMLSALQTAIINAHWKQLNVSHFNMMFDGRIVLN